MNKSDKIKLSEIQNIYKKDKRFFAYLADFLIQKGDQKKGVQIIKENINDFPDYTSGEMILGKIYYDANNFEKAEMLFRGSLAKDKESVKALKHLAGIEAYKGNREKQIELLSEVLKLDPFDQDSKNILRLADMHIPTEVVTAEPETKDIDRSQNEESFDKINSADDMEVPDLPIDDSDEILKKHKFGKDVLDKKASFSEDMTESLDTLTESFVNENRKSSGTSTVDNNDYSDILKPKEQHYISTKEHDMKVERILNDLDLSLDEYKEKMDAASSVIDEKPDDYESLVDFARARFHFAASSIKKEIIYYTDMVKEQPGNQKYNKKLISYKDELLRLNKELVEELNVLKNEYY